MAPGDERTIAFYDAEAAAYAAASNVRPPLLDSLIEELRPGARVLDLGCGAGEHSAVLRAAGFKVVSVDASAGLAAEAKRLWNVDVRILGFADLDYDAAFDAVWASASLHHAQAPELPAIFAAIRKALRPDGRLYATLKAHKRDRRDRFGRFYCAMDEAFLAALSASWRSTEIDAGEGTGYDGETTQWLALRALR